MIISLPKCNYVITGSCDAVALLVLAFGYVAIQCDQLQGMALSATALQPVSMTLQLQQGPARFAVQQNNVGLGLDIQTATADTTSEGANDFVVEQDPSTGVSTVAVNLGSVTVKPNNSALRSVTLQTGQQVEIAQNTISSVHPVGSPPSSGGGTPPPPLPPPSGGPSPSGSFLQIAQALDTNHNNKVDDEEIKTADIDWTTSQPVAGTSFTIGDDAMKQLFQLWVTGGSITAAGAAAAGTTSLTGLQVRSIEARTMSNHSVRFVASGQGITGIEAEVYDLSGRLVFDQATTGTALTFNSLSAGGHPLLANGVYLYTVTVRGIDGKTITSEVKKLVVVR